jgi:hypothetical protein
MFNLKVIVMLLHDSTNTTFRIVHLFQGSYFSCHDVTPYLLEEVLSVALQKVPVLVPPMVLALQKVMVLQKVTRMVFLLALQSVLVRSLE